MDSQPVETSTYGYDALDRLNTVASPGLSQSYALDGVGNRTSTTENLVTTTYTSNNVNQYTQVNAQAVTYDARGNLTGDGTLSMTYDSQNRLSQVVNGATTVDYQYDWANRLTSKSVNGQVTRYVYDGWTVIAETNNGGTIKVRYVVGPRTDEVLVQKKTGNTFYLTRDGLGSTTEVTRPNANVAQRFTYDAYGAVTVRDSSGAVIPDAPKTQYLFTGRELQGESGLYNYRNRFYHAKLGRFLQPDPIRLDVDNVNLYSYVGDNPVLFNDPFGLEDGSGGSGSSGSKKCDDKQKQKDDEEKKKKEKEKKEREKIILDFGPFGDLDLGQLVQYLPNY
jgi:RHS repeat-associated protein